MGRWNLNRCHMSVLVCESILGLKSLKPPISMSSSDKIVYAPRDESGHAHSRKVRSTWPKVIATESYRAREWRPEAVGRGLSPCEITFSRGKNPRPTASGSHSRARHLTITFGLVRRTWRSLRIPPLSSLYA